MHDDDCPGHGLVCACIVATCSGAAVPGFNFDTAASINAGQYQNASCPAGQLGYQTRLCQWNGYASATGTFVNPINYCLGTA